MRRELALKIIEDYKQREIGVGFMINCAINDYNSQSKNPMWLDMQLEFIRQHSLAVESVEALCKDFDVKVPEFSFEEKLGVKDFSIESIAESIFVKLQIDKGLSENPELRIENSRNLKALEIAMKIASDDRDFTMSRFLGCDSFVECLAVMV